MNGKRNSTPLAMLASGAAFSWISAWMTGLLVDPGSWPLRYILLGVGFLVALVLAGLWMRHLARDQAAAESFLDALSRFDPRDSVRDLDSADLPVLAPSNPWHESTTRLRSAFAENIRRAQDAEHSRSTLDVKMQRLRYELQQIRAILDSLSEPVVAIDSFDELVLANPSAQSLFNFDPESAEDTPIDRLLTCEKLVELLTDTRRRKTPTHRNGEIDVVTAEGSEQCFRVTANSIPGSVVSTGDDTRAHGAVAVLRDIGGHKAAQKRNAEFVSAVSHEMKTPLAGIKAYVELLADGDAEDEETREEFLNVINTQTDRLQRLIDNLLNLARIEAGVVNVSKQARSLNELLEEAFHVVHPSAEAKKIELAADLSPMYLGVLVDRDMITQAAINLLSNAIKYTPEEGRVTLRSRMRDHEIQFEVEDTGVGLSEEDQQMVFEKFYRVRKDRKMAQGTGLGLPLAKHIVEDVHGGRISLTSDLGKGSTFAVTLPNAGQMK